MRLSPLSFVVSCSITGEVELLKALIFLVSVMGLDDGTADPVRRLHMYIRGNSGSNSEDLVTIGSIEDRSIQQPHSYISVPAADDIILPAPIIPTIPSAQSAQSDLALLKDLLIRKIISFHKIPPTNQLENMKEINSAFKDLTQEQIQMKHAAENELANYLKKHCTQDLPELRPFDYPPELWPFLPDAEKYKCKATYDKYPTNRRAEILDQLSK
jgi:hypothetical protein